MGLALSDKDLRMPFGKHKDKLLDEVPVDYLVWCRDQDWLEERYPEVAGYIKRQKLSIDREMEEMLERRKDGPDFDRDYD